ncbi:Vta1 like-domain-containing protein [Entophlyctis helioformis]|nr:Vta1 like-domain-containing protein [Entophlyctis helioformis]
MASLPEPPEDLKFIGTYLQRAKELQTREPIVAYYCNYYAAKQAIEKGSTSKDSQMFLLSLLDALEQDKKNLAGNEAIANDVVGYAHIENFALKVFINADNEDRNGMASKKTAKTFLAASIFLELLKTFGELDPEIQQKIKYAKFKAADIIKALKEGRTPTPGPPGGDPADQTNVGAAAASSAPGPMSPMQTQQLEDPSIPIDPRFLPATAAAQTPLAQPHLEPGFNQQHQQHQQPPAAALDSGPSSLEMPTPPVHFPPPGHYANLPHLRQPPVPQYGHPIAPPPSVPVYSPSAPDYGNPAAIDERALQVMTQAQKHAKFAVSALQYEDVPTAIDNLQKALAMLQPYANSRK